MNQSVRAVANPAAAKHLNQCARPVEILDPRAITEYDVVTAAARDVVLALTPDNEQGQRRCSGIDDIVIARQGAEHPGCKIVMLERTLRIERKVAVAGRIEPDRNSVVAKTCVECGDGPDAGIQTGAGHIDAVSTVTTPDRDTAGKCSAGRVVDGRRRETEYLRIGDLDRSVGDASTGITHHQHVRIRAGINVQDAGDFVQGPLHSCRPDNAAGSGGIRYGVAVGAGRDYRTAIVLAIPGCRLRTRRLGAHGHGAYKDSGSIKDIYEGRRSCRVQFIEQDRPVVTAERNDIPGEESADTRRLVDIGRGRHINLILAGRGVDVGTRTGALNVELIVTRAKRDVQSLDAVIIDAVRPRGNVNGSCRQRACIDRRNRTGFECALECHGENLADFGHRHVVGVWL